MCQTNDKEIRPSKSGSAYEIHASWLYFGDIKIRDIFVNKHILGSGGGARNSCNLRRNKRRTKEVKGNMYLYLWCPEGIQIVICMTKVDLKEI